MTSFYPAAVVVDSRNQVLLGYNPFMETDGSYDKCLYWWLITYDDDSSCSVKPLFPVEGDNVVTSTDLISEVLFEDRELRLAILLIRKGFAHLRGMRIIYGRYDGVWALARPGTAPLLLPDVLVCADQYEEVVRRLLLNEQPCPIVKYFDILAKDEHERAIVNRYPDVVVQLRSLRVENVLLKEALAVHSPEQGMLLQAVQAENTELKGKMAKSSSLAHSLEVGCGCLRDM